MIIPKRNKTTSISRELREGRQLRRKVEKWAEEAALLYVDTYDSLNRIVANIAKRETLNELQIQRLIEETNTVTYNKLYDKKRNERDRRIEFDLASLSSVREEMGEQAPSKIENPNFPTGEAGRGEIQKKASVQEEIRDFHQPHRYAKTARKKYLEKQASLRKKEINRLCSLIENEISQDLDKIAHVLIRTEQIHKTANQLYNTLIDDAELTTETAGMIEKKASIISSHLVESKRIQPNFVLSLKQDEQEKTASLFLGEFSLLKRANESIRKEQPKMAPSNELKEYEELINLARSIQQKQQVVNEQKVNS